MKRAVTTILLVSFLFVLAMILVTITAMILAVVA